MVRCAETPRARKLRLPWALIASIALLSTVLIRPAAAISELEVEEDIAELMPGDPRVKTDLAPERTRPWAVLPQIGFGPETGPLVGAKLTHRNVLDAGIVVDVDGTYALRGQQSLGFSIAHPYLIEGKVLILFAAEYDDDPQWDFFGLGNNNFGPDPISTNEVQDIGGGLTLGWRPWERLALNFSVGLRQVNIRNGNQLDECTNFAQPDTRIRPCPFTPELLPDLPGVDGGLVNPLGISLVWNDRDDILRPTKGWRVILKIVNANHVLSDFKFTRYIADASYLRWFWKRRVVAGIRVNGEYIDSPSGTVPFWELSVLGGRDTLRGFFPYRFLGQSRLLINTELRTKLTDFNFFDLWRVRMDGVLFGDAGRVFLSNDDLEQEFDIDEDIFGRIISDFRYDFGFGLRIALARALLARIDVGFSEEEKGLLYLSFGHLF